MNSYLFVYGTLRSGELRHHSLEQAPCVSQLATISGKLVDTHHGYPAVVMDANSLVAGELYEIDEVTLSRMDRIEGYHGPGKQNLYDREICIVHTDSGHYEAWVYVSPQFANHPVIEHGDWKLHGLLQQTHLNYFAYGSCMDTERFEQKGVADQFTHVIGRGVLTGFNLQFRRKVDDGSGRADILEIGGVVEGKLYHITPRTLTSYLYGREGYNLNQGKGIREVAYRPAVVRVQDPAGNLLDAVTFVVVNKQSTNIIPPEVYMTEILRGAKPIVSERYYQQLHHQFVHEFGYPLGKELC